MWILSISTATATFLVEIFIHQFKQVQLNRNNKQQNVMNSLILSP